MERSITEQERETKDLIRRAKGNPDKTGSLRRDTLKRLIDLSHSPHSSLRILAAQNLRFLINDFPQLEEAAIDAIYDLCEDQSSRVRIEGYSAITQVSRANIKWVKRNADVLLQLLQSDEPDEVVVVKKALTEHLDMDPKVTLSVLCDQIAPADEVMDEEEQGMRVRLRSLVLSFLTGEAKRAIVERHDLSRSGAEEILLGNLLSAIPKLGYNDVEVIVKDLLLPLNAFKPGSAHGLTLVQILLDRVTSHLRNIRSGDVSLLHSARSYLDLVAFVVIDKRVAPAIELLRFYCSSISTKIILQRFPKEDQPLLICGIAETLVAASEAEDDGDGVPLDVLKRHVVDSCPFLLESLAINSASPPRLIKACAILLRVCLLRKEQAQWSPPPNLISTLGNIESAVKSKEPQDIQNLIRSLVPLSSNLIASQSKDTIPETAAKPHSPKRIDDVGRPFSLPERPQTGGPQGRWMSTPTSRSRTQYSVTADIFSGGIASSSTRAKHHTTPQPSSRPPKRLKGDTDTEPSLLRRLGSSVTNKRAASAMTAFSSNDNSAQLAPDISDISPNGGYSIKGAAKMDQSFPAQVPRHPVQGHSISLLDRLEDNSVQDNRAGRSRRWL